MAIDFPNAPALNQTFTVSGVTWQWDGTKWIVGGVITQGPLDAALHVPLNINSSMQVSQESGAGNIAVISNKYLVDGFIIGFVNATVASTWVQAGVPNGNAPSVGGSQNWLAVNITTAGATIAAGDVYLFQVPLEGTAVARLAWGTANARPVVVRFTIAAPMAGTYALIVINAASNRTYVRTFALATVNAFQTFYLTIPGDTIGTWPKDTSKNMTVGIAFAAGTTYQTAPGIWTAGTFFGATGQTNGIGVTGTWYIQDFAVYDATGFATDTGPPFVVPAYEQELARCMRYYQQVSSNALITPTAANQYLAANVILSPPMRASPTLTVIGATNNSNIGAVTNDTISANGFRQIAQSSAAAGFAQFSQSMKCDARL
jgi:hypothetical protein